MTLITAKVRIEHDREHKDSFTDFQYFERLDLPLDKEFTGWHYIKLGTILTLEDGEKVKVVDIITNIQKPNYESTGNPLYDYNLEIVYFVEPVK